MALVRGACEGFAPRDQWSKTCGGSPGTIVCCTDTSAALGFVKSKGSESSNSPCGHDDLFDAGLVNGTWTAYLGGSWWPSSDRRLSYESRDTSGCTTMK